MRILALNCGSSSLKFLLLDMPPHEEKELARGRITFGNPGTFRLCSPTKQSRSITVSNCTEALRLLFEECGAQGIFKTEDLGAIGHRVVHGGNRFSDSVILDKGVVELIGAANQLAPLHNRPALECIKEMRRLGGNSIPMVAVFDTEFHQTMPEHVRRYAIPEELTEKHGIRRYGFHGLAHRWMVERYFSLTGGRTEGSRLITLHLGSGCSLAAIREGRSVETSMGLTPLEGLMMATRCGDIDPSLPAFLARLEQVGPEEVEKWLNTRSGLLGVSGKSGDVRVLLEAERTGDRRATLALQMFCHRIRKYVGAYLAVLGGADALLFGGGIGEHQPAIRSRLCEGMDWCGLRLDESRNTKAVGRETCISAIDSEVVVYVVPVNEELLIARETFQCVNSTRSAPERPNSPYAIF